MAEDEHASHQLQPLQPQQQRQQQQLQTQPFLFPAELSSSRHAGSSGQNGRCGSLRRLAVGLCVVPVFITLAVAAGVERRHFFAHFAASPSHTVQMVTAPTVPLVAALNQSVVWTLAPEYMSCDHGCRAMAALRQNGNMGCCREDSWPENETSFRTRVMGHSRFKCSDVVPGGFASDPSMTRRGLCGWQSRESQTSRCAQNPLDLTRRFCPCSLPSGPENEFGELTFVSLADFDPMAVCNDGSPAGYYWRPAAEGAGQEHIWFVLLQGGGQCYDIESCKKRAKHASSSENYKKTRRMGGVFAKASPVYNANQIFVPYCSSDGYAGNVGAEDNPTGLHFRGARIIEAIFKHLVAARGLHPPHLVVFGGYSSGARGAMIHLDRLVWPHGPLPEGTRVLGYLDSPLWIDQATLPTPVVTGRGDPMTNLTNETVQLMNLANTYDAVTTPECIERYGDAWKCWFGMYRIPILKTPFLIVASQYDGYQMSVNLQYGRVRNHSWPSPQEAYSSWANLFAAATREQLKQIVNKTVPAPPPKQTDSGQDSIPWIWRFLGLSSWLSSGPKQVPQKRPQFHPPPLRAVLSWSCYSHAQSTFENFFKLQVDGVSMAEALRVAIANVTADEAGKHPMPVLMDTCGALDCGRGCSRIATC